MARVIYQDAINVIPSDDINIPQPGIIIGGNNTAAPGDILTDVGKGFTNLLFDLAVDEGEHNNLYKEKPEVVEEMMKRIIEVDQTIVNSSGTNDPKCPNAIPYNDSVVGKSWMPWCNKSNEIMIEW